MIKFAFYAFLFFVVNFFIVIPSLCFDGNVSWARIKRVVLIINGLITLIILCAELLAKRN